jgi:hypothetical protein
MQTNVTGEEVARRRQRGQGRKLPELERLHPQRMHRPHYLAMLIESKTSRTFLSNPSRVKGFSRKAQLRSQASPSFTHPLRLKNRAVVVPRRQEYFCLRSNRRKLFSKNSTAESGHDHIGDHEGKRPSVLDRHIEGLRNGSPVSSTVYPESSRSRRVSPRRGAASSTSRIVSVPLRNGFAICLLPSGGDFVASRKIGF